MNFANYSNHLGVLTKRGLIRDQGVRSFCPNDSKAISVSVNPLIQSFFAWIEPFEDQPVYAHQIRAKSETLDRVMAERERVLAFYFD